MLFYLSHSARHLPPHSECFLLVHDNWNDWYTYKTLYTLYYINSNHTPQEIGGVKIGELTPTATNAPPNLPHSFSVLSETEFISLGQDTTYYENLTHIVGEQRDTVLTALNDIAYNETLYAQHKYSALSQRSLLRNFSHETVTNQLNRMAHGGARLTPYNFIYQYHAQSLQLTFNVTPDSLPPTNIHVIIARNGSGKTFLLQQMISSALANNNTPPVSGGFRFTLARSSSQNPQNFSNIVCLAFSIFDEFPPSSNANVKYTYIGVSKDSTDIKADLAKQFTQSILNCRGTRSKYKRWQSIITMLNTDPIFREINLTQNIDNIFLNPEINTRPLAETELASLFNQLSSGHKIVALTITRLVECVEERTLVLLDEPELHLHPPLLSAFTRALSNLLIDRNGVAIIATHSPVLLQEVPQNCIWKIHRSGNLIRANRPNIQTFGENISSLTIEVFGLEVTHSGFYNVLQATLRTHQNSFRQALAAFHAQLGNEAISILKLLSLNPTEDS